LRDFKELKVWEKSHQLALEVYKATAQFPRQEAFGLTGQIRRACISIPSNIAEGSGRNGTVELARFFNIAMGSASEVEYQLMLARDLDYLSRPDYDRLATHLAEVKRMLASYIQKVKLTRDGKDNARNLISDI